MGDFLATSFFQDVLHAPLFFDTIFMIATLFVFGPFCYSGRSSLERNTNEEIAKILGIKKTAVENYVSRIYEKIDVKDRTELIERFG